MRSTMVGALAALALAGAGAARAADVNLGRKLFTAKCVTCHGKDGKGNPMMAKMFKVPLERMNWTSELNKKKSDEELKKVILGGNGKMPSFKSQLKDADVAGVVAFVRSLQGVKAAAGAKATRGAPAKTAEK